MGELRPASALAHLGGNDDPAQWRGDGLVLSELPGLAVTLLLDRPGNPCFDAEVARVLGVAPPREPNTIAGGSLAWIAPGQWLAIGTELAEPLGIDLSDAYCAIAVKGEHGRDLLSKSVPLDLDGAAVAPGRCARTLMGSIPIVMLVRGMDEWLILVDRSLAHAAWAWLIDAAVGIGVVTLAGQDL